MRADGADALGGRAMLKNIDSLLEREAYYERARTAYAVIATGERRPYEDFILVKGVIAEDGRGG